MPTISITLVSNQSPQAPVFTGAKDLGEEFTSALPESPPSEKSEKATSQDDLLLEDAKEKDSGAAGLIAADDPMDEDVVNPATVFCINLNQLKSNLLHKMSVPDLCRTFSTVAWCGKLNAIACASETCARIPSSSTNRPFWIPVHIVIPERPTESTVFNVIVYQVTLPNHER